MMSAVFGGDIMESFLRPWRRYADFTGRSRRREFFAFYGVFYGLVFAAAFVLGWEEGAARYESMGGIAMIVVVIVGFVPSWAVKIRRLHDQDRSGWWSLATIVPYLGWIATLIIGLLPGTPGENAYGVDPRSEGPAAQEELADIFS
jgi:uncharacterized membrane protein YhaH (DUF805 family)